MQSAPCHVQLNGWLFNIHLSHISDSGIAVEPFVVVATLKMCCHGHVRSPCIVQLAWIVLILITTDTLFYLCDNCAGDTVCPRVSIVGEPTDYLQLTYLL